MLDVVSVLPGADWPGMPSKRGCQILSLQFQLEQSQWLTMEQIEAHQFRQLAQVVAHAADSVPFYRDRLSKLRSMDHDSIDLVGWRQMPLLRRSDVQRAGPTLYSTNGVHRHGESFPLVTSGSTGEPVATLGTEWTRLIWNAITLRQHIWHRRDLSCKFAAIRFQNTPDGLLTKTNHAETWGTATAGVVHTGPAVGIDIRNTIDVQAEWLARENPDYLLTYPSNAMALAHHCLDHGLEVTNLRELRTFGESVDPRLGDVCRQAWNAPLVDSYSSQEVGYIALQCPSGDGYHIQSESLLVEVINEAGNPCEASEVGRVVVTTLHNFAMPLLRYEIGDLAEVGPPCKCGRGLPVLKRILGRERNMFRLPTGEKIWPDLTMDAEITAEAMAAIRQFQIIQKEVDRIEARLVVNQPLDQHSENAMKDWLNQSLGYPFQIDIHYVDAIARNAGGKFEDFRCELAD
jgi:phenylacetate-CoA ligase